MHVNAASVCSAPALSPAEFWELRGAVREADGGLPHDVLRRCWVGGQASCEHSTAHFTWAARVRFPSGGAVGVSGGVSTQEPWVWTTVW